MGRWLGCLGQDSRLYFGLSCVSDSDWLRTGSLKYARSLVQGKLSNTMSAVKEEKQSRNLKYFNLGWSNLLSGLGESPLFCLSPSLGLIQHRFSLKPGVVEELRTSIRISYSKQQRPGEVCRTWQELPQTELRDMPGLASKALQASTLACLGPVAFSAGTSRLL